MLTSRSGMRVTVQFTCRLFYPNNEKPGLWATDPLSNYGFDEEQHSFYADGCSIELSEDGSYYTIKAAVNENSMVNVKFTRTAPGFMGGKNGTTNYGTDPKAPWGSMHHHFWPRAKVEGSIITKEGEVNVNGRGMFSHAVQGMKPHHAGKHAPSYWRRSGADFYSCAMELCQLPISFLLCRPHGVHDSRLICQYRCTS
jgi:hypothetical protein